MEFPLTEEALGAREMRELFVLAQIVNQRIPESETSLDSLLARGLKTPGLREFLATACLEWKHDEKALELLRTLITERSDNPRVYATAARLAFERHVPTPSINARLTTEDADDIRGWCHRALAIEPHEPRANGLLAWTDALGPEVIAEDATEISEICHRMDGNGRTDDLLAALAVARWRQGNTTSARRACDLLLNASLAGDKARGIATALLPELAQPPTARITATSGAISTSQEQ